MTKESCSWSCGSAPHPWICPLRWPQPLGRETPALSLAVLGEAVEKAVQCLFPKGDELQKDSVGFLPMREEIWAGISSEPQSITTGAPTCTFLATVSIIL